MRCTATVSFSRRGLEVDVGLEEAAHECLVDAHEAEEEATELECLGEHCISNLGVLRSGFEIAGVARRGCCCAGVQRRRGRVFVSCLSYWSWSYDGWRLTLCDELEILVGRGKRDALIQRFGQADPFTGVVCSLPSLVRGVNNIQYPGNACF